MTQRRINPIGPLGLALTSGLLILLGGCGDPEIKPPPQAVLHQATGLETKKTWTKQDKIDAINKSSIPADQKKAEIDKVNAGQD